MIGHLRYSDLNKQKQLPKKPLFTTVVKRGGTFPSLAKKIGYDQFGIYIDYFIRVILSKHFNLDNSLKKQNYYSLFCMCCSYPISKEELSKIRDYLSNIGEFVLSAFESAKIIDIEPEWSSGNIVGHPDLVIDDTVYDIKTTGQFGKMRQHTILQLLSYYCLAQLNNKQITHVGIVLPAQSVSLRVSLKEWNWKPFWDNLQKCIHVRDKLQPSLSNLVLFQSMIMPYVGTHINKEKTLEKTLSLIPPVMPVQLFFGGRAQARFSISDLDIGRTMKAIEEHGYRFYVHAPYTLNLSRKYDDDWVVNSVKKHLTTAVSAGSKGVVIHCGVQAEDNKDAYKNMYDAVVRCSEDATPECPLLIETSAGETGELLSSPAELIAFYTSLPDDTKKRVKICVDTCHVFVAGYEPMDFVKELIHHSVPIGLFHYNDAQGDKGCCHDCHATVGYGYVGFDRLIELGAFAIQNKIDLVHE